MSPKGPLWTPFLWLGRRLASKMTLVHPPLTPPKPQEDAPPAAPSPSPAPAVPLALRQAKRLGLEFDPELGVATRGGAALQVRGDAQAHSLWEDLLGIRLALDAAHAPWTPELERPTPPPEVYQKHQIPSPYGERLPWVVPRRSVARWEAETGRVAVRAAHGLGQGVEVVFVLEMGRAWHVLGQEDLAALGWSLEKVQHDAVRALFYVSYKVRPTRTVEGAGGVIRVYQSSEGLGAARIVLLPDFDFDAARARGWATLASRDHMLVLEPTRGGEERQALAPQEAVAWLEEVAAEIREEALFPMRGVLLALDPAQKLHMQ